MEVGIGKGVQDPKCHAMARHEFNFSFLLLILVNVKLQIVNLKYFIPIAWGIFRLKKGKYQGCLSFPQANPLVKYIVFW